jgi:hypothetical protein
MTVCSHLSLLHASLLLASPPSQADVRDAVAIAESHDALGIDVAHGGSGISGTRDAQRHFYKRLKPRHQLLPSLIHLVRSLTLTLSLTPTLALALTLTHTLTLTLNLTLHSHSHSHSHSPNATSCCPPSSTSYAPPSHTAHVLCWSSAHVHSRTVFTSGLLSL